ncbi:DUF1194 domain-containing protein [Puniceibacterium sp. IMCC21224]|uniref:DUF1194 domain-containing protein n=1 Tax=Puniceibacterium sp. IMCC21224 TaxID=1618204 RepID=UPI00064E06FC|nr:DUF1194 domain-containing protein [Puniceibacterium sp. IMCC21224]KMK68929.1 Protein of unknown function (DUF1194) [Puniceibacterium sp. IMCC21224]
MRRLLCLALLLWSGVAQAGCRQALALGLDVSGSVDSREYRLQMDGLAAALLHPEIREALLALPDAPVALAVFEWSGPESQMLVLDWTVIIDEAALQGAAAQLRAARRHVGDPSTAIGAALQFGAGLLAQQPNCWKRTLDLSGDGQSNTGPHPRDLRDTTQAAGLTVNGLVVATHGRGDRGSTGIGELSAYFRAYVISGPDAFVETALGFDAFEAAMVRKLKRELQGPIFSAQ